MRKVFEDRRVLVIGGFGFIGANLSEQLGALGARVTIVTRSIDRHRDAAADAAARGAHVVEADLRDADAMRSAVAGQEVVFNLAGQSGAVQSMQDPFTDLDVNCRGNLVLLEALRTENRSAKLVVASSYRPVGEDRIRRDQRDAPDDIQWTINPTQDVDSALRSVEDMARDRGLEVASEARQGDPADVLCEIAEEHGADLLVVGNKGMQRRVLGSVPNSVSHKAPCSVVIVKTT